LVEGGGTLNEELLKQNAVDELYVYIAPLIFGGASAPTLASGSGLERDAAIHLSLTDVEKLGEGGIVIHYVIRTR
jgi:riboflavin biosynthesis pyrimidine reductase